MPYLTNILRKLKEHSVNPPDELFDAIRMELKNEKAGAVSDSEGEFDQKINTLAEREIAPPPFLLDNILKVIQKEEVKKTTIIAMPRQYKLAIAASILLALGIWGVITLQTSKQPLETETAVTEQSGKKTVPVVQNHDTLTTATASAQKTDQSVKKNIHAITRVKNLPATFSTAYIDGYSFPVKNDDLLYSFASFKYNNLPSFITNDRTEAVKVRVDNSTAITISEGMVSMMKRMYKTKRNGKPTVRARKERKKLQRWKDSDAKFFDKNVEKNPMDPFDLAEFIF